jgi:ATP/ADP translocase
MPFFGVYLLLFGAFTVADGVSLALFVQDVGAGALPSYYAVTAMANVVLIGGYVLVAERLGSLRTFQIILGVCAAIYATVWWAIRFLGPNGWYYGVLFVVREVGYTLVLLHFGTWLQDFFKRDEMNRVLPVIYAGGRLGGIAGGVVLEWLSRWLGPVNLVLVFAGLCLVSLACLVVIKRWIQAFPREERSVQAAQPPAAAAAEPGLEEEARSSFRAFLRFVWSSPMLFWLTAASVLFMVIRWVLNYEYNAFFGSYFADSVAMAEFLGRYAQVALFGSLVIQLLVVNRLVAWLGIAKAYLGYAALVFAAVALCLLPMTLAIAVFCRLVETELRFGLRNPLTQMITNQFSRSLRIRVRAWTMGLLTPVGTLAASGLLSGLALAGLSRWVSWVGGGLGLTWFLSALGLCRSFKRQSATRKRQAESLTKGTDHVPSTHPGGRAACPGHVSNARTPARCVLP